MDTTYYNNYYNGILFCVCLIWPHRVTYYTKISTVMALGSGWLALLLAALAGDEKNLLNFLLLKFSLLQQFQLEFQISISISISIWLS